MKVKKLAEKLSDYNARLERGKAEKIHKDHVLKVMKKLHKKEVDLEADIASENKPEKKVRLQRKLGVAREHIARAEWLLAQLE